MEGQYIYIYIYIYICLYREIYRYIYMYISLGFGLFCSFVISIVLSLSIAIGSLRPTPCWGPRCSRRLRKATLSWGKCIPLFGACCLFAAS